jgi:DNA invertase Pin-like site-specific DNA recombinase
MSKHTGQKRGIVHGNDIMGTMNIGYARVSTIDQQTNLQTDALEKVGCERIYVEHASGAKASRPELDRMLEALRPGDTVIVWRLDRLGRNLEHLIQLVNQFTENNIGFRSLTEQLDGTTAQGRMFLNLAGTFAQYEREGIIERTKAGLRAAKARGHIGGRPKALSDEQIIEIRKLHTSGSMTNRRISEIYQVSMSTINRAIHTQT